MSGSYRVAPIFVVRLAGVPFEPLEQLATPAACEAARAGDRDRVAGELAKETPRVREALLRAAREILPPYLVFGMEGFGERVAALLSDDKTDADRFTTRNSTARKREKHLLLYLQRVCAKNDTFSEFGPSVWGRVEPADALELECSARIAKREVFFERWVAHAVAAAVNTDPEIPTPVGVPALEPFAFDVLLEDVRNWPEGDVRTRWLQIFEPLAQLKAQFADADVNQRSTCMREARERLRQLGAARSVTGRALYAATNPIAEECARDCRVVLPQKMADELAHEAEPWIDLWRDCYAFVAHRVSNALRMFLPGDNPVSLPEFLGRAEANKMPLTSVGMIAPAVVAFAELKAAFRAMIGDRADAPEIQLTRDDCHFVRRNFEFPKFDEYTFPSADLQISASSIDSARAGEYEWIISEFHPPVALLHHAFFWSCPDKETLAREIAKTSNGAPAFHYGFFAADFTAHTVVHQMDVLPETTFVTPQRANPKWRRIAPEETEVFVDEVSGDVRLRVRASGELLGSFARSWIIPLGFHPFYFGRAPHMPRLRCGRVIVQRRSWTVTLSEIGTAKFNGISADLLLAIERLRAARGLPRFVYVRPTEQALRRSGAEGRDKDTKPVFVDFESYLSMEIFHRWLVKSGELELTEMLPDPDHLLWRESDGRHTFELRTLIVPRT
ncbi:MAG: hypothetical protein ACJ8KU_04305 [Chthoniobacterales bacterium]